MPLRQAQTSDTSSLAALSIEVWLGTYIKHGINSVFADYVLSEFTTAKMETILADDTQHIIVSENKDGIDGFIRISTHSKAPGDCPSTTEIATFYVQSRHHGKGIGKMLLNAACEYSRNIGANSIWLSTNSENHPAIGFYLAQGFTQVGHTHFQLQDQKYRNNVYCLTLDENPN